MSSPNELLARMSDALKLLPDPATLAAVLEVGPVLATAVRQIMQRPSDVSGGLGIPVLPGIRVVTRHDLGPSGWRIISATGDVLREGGTIAIHERTTDTIDLGGGGVATQTSVRLSGDRYLNWVSLLLGDGA